MEYSHKDNLYALSIKDEVVFIGEVISGRKGYFCLGCKREMQAVIARKSKRKSYFRHDPKDVQGKGKCTYSDEAYRIQLAKTILQDIKKIKVPSLYKYPPKGENGLANLIAESKYIFADSVGIEYCFYENDAGIISFGKSDEHDSKHLLIKPNVTFFDKDQKPILFIELASAHKISEEKLLKLKRLGIDTVQVIVPKDSPEAISEVFSQTIHTKWLYNYEQEHAKYIPIREPITEGISSVDEIQRHFFEESYKCRTAQINNLIRTIKKCLESEYYRDIERSIRSEISRVERITKENSNEWFRIQERGRTEVYSEHQKESSECEEFCERIREAEIKFQERNRGLESRYLQRKSELENEIDSIRKSESFLFRGGETIGNTIAREGIAIKSIEQEQAELERKEGNFESLRDSITNRNSELKTRTIERFDENRRRTVDEIERIQSKIESLSREFESLEKSEAERYRKLEEQTILESAEFDRSILAELEKGEIGNHGNISQYIKRSIDGFSLLDNISEVFRTQKQYQDALTAIRTRAYKNWL